MTRLEIRQKIVSLLFDIDNYREASKYENFDGNDIAMMYKKVEQLRNTIEYLEYMLQSKNLKDDEKNS